MLFKLYLPFTTLVVSFCGLSHASKAIKNDVPDSYANKDDLKASLVLHKKIIRFLSGSRALYQVTRNFKSIECKKSSQWTLSGYSCILCTLLLVVVTFLATLKDRHSREEFNQNERKNADNKKKASVWITCFSLDTSLKAFRWTESRSENMDCLSGLRFLTTLWIVSLHFVHFQISLIENSLALPDNDKHFLLIGEIDGLATDTFFLLSGLLISYQFFRGVQSGHQFNLINFCLKRYLRLIRPVVFPIWFHSTVFTHLGSGSFWDDGNGDHSEVVNCQKHWWRTALGIKNFYPFETQCQSWTWQVAADLQVSILSPVYLFALKRSLRLGMVFIALSTVLSVLVTGVSTWKAGTRGFTSFQKFLKTAYFPTWCRLGPYFIGIILGYFLATNKATIYSISKSTAKKITWISVFLCVSMLLIPLLSLEELSAASFYFVQKVLWSLGLAGLIILSLSGHLPTFNRFLSWKPFVQLSQLSFSVIIVHVLVYYYFLNQLSTPLTFTPMSTLVMLIGLQPAVFTIASLFFVLVESPINQLGKILFSASFEKKIK